jgi:hypothetical protein
MSLRGSHENVISEYIFWRHMLVSGEIFKPSICQHLQGFFKSCTVRKLLTFDLVFYLPSMWFMCWTNFAIWEKCFLSRTLSHKFYDFKKKITTICLQCGRMVKTCFYCHILNIAKLGKLQLGSCHSLEWFPTSIGGLTSLKKLNCEYANHWIRSLHRLANCVNWRLCHSKATPN